MVSRHAGHTKIQSPPISIRTRYSTSFGLLHRKQGFVRTRLIFANDLAPLRFGSETPWLVACIGLTELGFVFCRSAVRSLSPHLE